ncbi:NAD-dependent succinate-semialdehyde dehydrogenase [Pseudomonadota bacterium]
MAFVSLNPATGQKIKEVPTWGDIQLEEALVDVAIATPQWAKTPLQERCDHVRRLGLSVVARRDELAELITLEVGKLISEARAEVDKCVSVCDYYADNGPAFLSDEMIESDAGKSFVAHLPLGTILAVMPWNFPLWQVFRFLAPALVAGNTGVLKHASNVPQCALAIESLVRDAGLPNGVFRSLMISAGQVAGVIEDERVHAVTLTGSEPAGRKVAATAGANLKKTVLELGGSDPFIVLEDADLDLAVPQGVASRFLNAGQSCIAAKRFIVVDSVADDFVAKFKIIVEALKPGNPNREGTTLGPMARADLRDELHEQVQRSINAGAIAVTGCAAISGNGAFYQASILDHVKPGMAAWEEEFFGPVAIIIRVKDEREAIKVANGSDFGLGGSVWTKDSERGERVARSVQSGAVFVNGMVKSDPRLPFGGVKNSGYGRELCHHGMLEFVNQKTIWVR